MREIGNARVAAAVVGLAILAADPASALDRAALERIFPAGKAVCFERRYDAAHLAGHPKQRLVHFRLYRTAADIEQSARSTPPGLATIYSVMTSYRTPKGVVFIDGNACTFAPGAATATCARACDGQGYALELRPGGRLLVSGFRRAWDADCDEVSKSGVLTGTGDDRILLEPAPLARCDETEARRRAPWAVFKKSRGG